MNMKFINIEGIRIRLDDICQYKCVPHEHSPLESYILIWVRDGHVEHIRLETAEANSTLLQLDEILMYRIIKLPRTTT